MIADSLVRVNWEFPVFAICAFRTVILPANEPHWWYEVSRRAAHYDALTIKELKKQRIGCARFARYLVSP